jgi:catechol 2,3-dioxygenase-like lactoylglutathione lyase family enzyme
MQFHHVGVSVTDIDRSIAFYRDLLDMEQLCEVFPFGGEQFEAIMDIPGVGGRMCMMGRNSLQLELFEFANAKPKDAAYPVSDRGYSHFGVVVDDVDATYERLRAADVRIHCPVISFMGGSMKAAYCRDPDGNVFEIMQPGQVQD